MRRLPQLVLFAGLAAFLAALLLLGAVAVRSQENDPRQLVVGYMEALKKRDYVKALGYAGMEVPPQVSQMLLPLMERQIYVQLVVKKYVIKDVRVDGGLAEVTVEETHFKDLSASLRSNLSHAGKLGQAIRWGDNKVTETFVLVKLKGRWQFDTCHSGIQFQEFPFKELTEAFTRRNPPGDALQMKVAGFINNIGIGQVLQSLGTAGPAVPLLAAMAIPNFRAAEQQGTLVACQSNLKNLGTALEMYSTDNSGRYPLALSGVTPLYLKQIPTCPAAARETYSAGYRSGSNPDAFTVYCGGQNHVDVQIPVDFPQYNSTQGLIVRPEQ